MEGKNFEIAVFVDEKITCELFVKEQVMNLFLVKVKEILLEDVSEFLPQHYHFLKPMGGSSKIPPAAKQEKLVTLKKCLVECSGEFFLYL